MNIVTIEIQNEHGSQEIRIPKQYKIDDDKVYIKKIGNVIYLIPFHNPWQNLFESLDKFTPDFMEDRDQTLNQIREDFE